MLGILTGDQLGGGCEIALAVSAHDDVPVTPETELTDGWDKCDIIYAEDDAKFGLPEITIGTIPGIGGTQRFARALGKYRVWTHTRPLPSCLEPLTDMTNQAMELILTGDSVAATELQHLGLVNKVFPKGSVEGEAIKLARRIAALSAPVVASAKQAVLTGENVTPYLDCRRVLLIRVAFSRELASRGRHSPREGAVLRDVQHS